MQFSVLHVEHAIRSDTVDTSFCSLSIVTCSNCEMSDCNRPIRLFKSKNKTKKTRSSYSFLIIGRFSSLDTHQHIRRFCCPFDTSNKSLKLMRINALYLNWKSFFLFENQYVKNKPMSGVLQIAQTSHSTSQLHIATKFHRFNEKQDCSCTSTASGAC